MDSAFLLYLVSIIDSIDGTFSFITIILGLYLMIASTASFFGVIDNSKSFRQNASTFKIKQVLIAMSIFNLGAILTPSKNELLMIIGVSSIIEYSKNSEEMNKLPDNAVKALNIWLENLNTEESPHNEDHTCE